MVRIQGTFLHSAVARRVILLFFLSAFVPVAILGVLSYRQVHYVISESGQRQLTQTASAYARSVYDHLLGASSILSADAAQIRILTKGMASQPTNFGGVFLRVYHVSGGQATLRWGSSLQSLSLLPVTPDAMDSHLAKGKIAVLPARATGGAPTTWLAVRIDAARAEMGELIAELDPKYLWDDPEALPFQTHICVVNQGTDVLYCSHTNLVSMAKKAALQGDGNKPTSVGDWLVVRYGLFLKPKFAQADWNIVAMRRGGLAFEALTQMAQTMVGIVVATLLLVALLSVSQIRRTLVPLERLMEGTRRIAREQFDKPVEIKRKDEFGQLADSLNSMAHRLGENIGAMHALSHIDQQILAHSDIAQIIDSVQKRILEILPHSRVGVVVPDGLSADLATVYLRKSGDKQALQSRRSLENFPLSTLNPNTDVGWLDASSSMYRHMPAWLADTTPLQYFLLPVVARDVVVALIVVGTNDRNYLPEPVLNQIRDLGGRIGVALAAHAREAQLVFMARHDGLTGLPNRDFLRERMEQELVHARRDGSRTALLFIDLDRFKNVNDSLGHDAGDQLLCQVADRLRLSVRDSDTIARLGGDEFVVLQTGIQRPQHAAKTADHILQALAQPFVVSGSEQFIGASIGMAIFPDDGCTVDELLKRADMAMYSAKDAGRGRLVFFEESMNRELQERTFLEQELRQAISRGQLTVQYQPRIRLLDGHVSGAEALLRWHHPEIGSVSPARFIPLAEDSGLIDEIGPWVLRHVCKQMATWKSTGYAIGKIAVNLSGRQLRVSNLVEQVRQALADFGLDPQSLELEVTESVLIHDVEFVITLLNQLRTLGVSIALDDFGTDYSSMMYLKRLPINILKIDRSFVTDLSHDEGSRSIAQAIIALAHALNKSVVAEGVETQGQADLLRDWGCEEVQGYYFSQPLSADAFEKVMHKESDAQS